MRHSFNTTRMVLKFCGNMLYTCQIKFYDAGRVLGETRFWAEFKVKIARSRCALDGLGWFI